MPILKEIAGSIFDIVTIWFRYVFIIISLNYIENRIVILGYVLFAISLWEKDIINFTHISENSFFRSKVFMKSLQVFTFMIYAYVIFFIRENWELYWKSGSPIFRNVAKGGIGQSFQNGISYLNDDKNR